MSLDVCLTRVQTTSVFDQNITHNLNRMAEEAGIYKHLSRPEELGIEVAADLVIPLSDGLALMRSDPKRFRAFDAKNGWGTYDQFLPWIEKYRDACDKYPDAAVSVSR